ncbi:MAG: eukaryotic-like serine/threonine-protein kinase [Gaiellaceae bacterium]|nr:eukaryotic-like serine/threonine-protein kinase [Gaiellaceae bacterium]
MVGEVLSDRYEVEELVGTGGMSSVFRAHDRLLDRKVALKVLHQQFTGDADYVERFRREARAVAALSHPNIVTVIDRGEHGNRQFIVFEYIDGENLKALIQRRGPAPVTTALELALQNARGLSFAHQQGLVHRDVKPQNVLLNGDGQAKVTDFGIARSLDVQHGMTQTGTVLGTSDYIAPEQAQGQRVDEHTDVYSLGVVLYEMLTNEVPFPGENFVAVAMRHINEAPPPIRDKRPDVSPRLEAAVHRAMAKRPEDRFQTMADFCRELEANLAETQGQTVVAPAPPRKARATRRQGANPWPIVLALLTLIAIGAVIAYLLVHRNNGNTGATAGTGGVPTLVATGAYDPYGTGAGGENDARAKYATDGNGATYWETEQYYNAPSLNKPGVGLVLDAKRVVQLQQLGVATSTPGFTAVIRAGDSTTHFPDTVSAPQTVGGRATFTIVGKPHRYYLLWITRLGPGYNTAQINEVKAS